MKTNLRIFENLDLLSRAATEYFVSSTRHAIERRGRSLVAISGGSTPTRTYSLLASPGMLPRVDWSKIYVFWADERCVPPDQPESNYGEAHKVLFSKIPIPPENVLRIHGELTPAKAANDYTKILKGFATHPLEWPVLDLVLLGLGEDGHTASLFPGSPIEVTVPCLAVTAHYMGRPANRVTMTPLVFNSARRILFLVTGASKAPALASVLEWGALPEKYPAQRIRPVDGEVIWLVDQAAAGEINNSGST
jgi:6-phosphogluconolactonase